MTTEVQHSRSIDILRSALDETNEQIAAGEAQTASLAESIQELYRYRNDIVVSISKLS